MVSGSSLVGVCRHLAAVMCSTYTTVLYTTVVYTTVVYTTVVYTTVVSIVDLWSLHNGRVYSTQARRWCP